MLHVAQDGTVLTARELETLFDFITEEVERLGACDSEEGALAVLTSDNRTKWAESRETYFAEVCWWCTGAAWRPSPP